MLRRSVWPVAVLVCLAAGAARGDTTEAQARAHYEIGHGAYQLGKYEEAIREFRDGYELIPKPEFLLNIAQAYRQLGDQVNARVYYARYLESMPADAAEREGVRKIIAELESMPPKRVTPPPALGSLSHPVTSRHARREAIAGYCLLGLGLGLAGGGAGLEVLAQSTNDQLNHPAPGTVYDPDMLARRDLYHGAGVALLIVGGAGIVTGGVLAILGSSSARAH